MLGKAQISCIRDDIVDNMVEIFRKVTLYIEMRICGFLNIP